MRIFCRLVLAPARTKKRAHQKAMSLKGRTDERAPAHFAHSQHGEIGGASPVGLTTTLRDAPLVSNKNKGERDINEK